MHAHVHYMYIYEGRTIQYKIGVQLEQIYLVVHPFCIFVPILFIKTRLSFSHY